jgi:hypothetical protein
MKLIPLLLALLWAVTLHAESSAAAAGTADVAGLRFTVPKNWVDAQPLSPVRAAQWSVPPLKGEGGYGEVVAFYFGPGQGGDTKANVDRWLSTMTQPDGTPAQGDVTVRKTNGFTITQVLILGTYTNAMAAPGIPPTPRPGYGLIGVVIERPEGSVFFRFTGPEALVKSQLVTFTKFIDTIKPAS